MKLKWNTTVFEEKLSHLKKNCKCLSNKTPENCKITVTLYVESADVAMVVFISILLYRYHCLGN